MIQNEARLIVLEKLKTYTLDTRAVNQKGMCTYLNEEGRVCIAGAFMTIPSLAQKIADATNRGGIGNPIIFEYLNKIGKKAGMKFMVEVQSVHDDPNAWDENGLSYYGNNDVNAIIRKFKIKAA